MSTLPYGGQYISIPIFNQLVPDEGPKSIKTYLDFASVDIYDIDLTQVMEKKIIRSVQTLYVDNANNANPLTITTDLSQQRIIFPANSQGYIPLLLPVPGIIHVQAPNTSKCSIHMLNVPMAPYIWAVV